MKMRLLKCWQNTKNAESGFSRVRKVENKCESWNSWWGAKTCCAVISCRGVSQIVLIAPLASLSQRPEFASKIAPSVVSANGFVQLHFKMFIEGDPKTVKIDDKLPFDKNHNLVYARSLLNDGLYLASYFEKVFVKQACFGSYIRCDAIDETFVYSLFSECMVSQLCFKMDQSKQPVVDQVAFEIDNKSSVVLSIAPALEDEPDFELDCWIEHSYVVIGYDSQLRIVRFRWKFALWSHWKRR